MWITSEHLAADEAKEALKNAVPTLNDFISKGQIKILPYTQWYLKDEEFDAKRVLKLWQKEYATAETLGFNRSRVTGDMYWVNNRYWTAFTEYEALCNVVHLSHPVTAICNYCTDQPGLRAADTLKNHFGFISLRD